MEFSGALAKLALPGASEIASRSSLCFRDRWEHCTQQDRESECNKRCNSEIACAVPVLQPNTPRNLQPYFIAQDSSSYLSTGVSFLMACCTGLEIFARVGPRCQSNLR